MADNRQSITTNPNIILGDHPLLEHSNGNNATQASMPARTRPSTLPEVDLNQLSRMVSYLAKQIKHLQ